MTKPTHRWLPALAAVLGLAAALAAIQAPAFVNPNFTPKNVETASKVIFTVRVESVDADGKGAALAVDEVIKGELAAKKLRLDLKSATPDAKPEDFLELLKAAEKRPALVAAGEFEGKACALMHIEACWVRLAKGADDASWTFDRIDTSLNGTFNGGTDMFIETMKFMRKFPGAPIMPVSGGIQWTEHAKLGALPGKAAALLAVDANADGKLDLFAACPEGDRVFLRKADGKFEEKALEPGAKSLAAAWADFDGDGRPDLASLGKDGLKVWLQKEPGKFTAAAVAEIDRVETASPTVAVIDLEPDGKPDLVVGAGSVPVVCKNDGKGGLHGEAMPALILQEGKGHGAAGPCVVADFDADGFADIVEVFQTNGLIRRGKPGGFDPPAKCGALMGKPKSRSAHVADLDGDGLLDIFLIGGGSTPYMLQNRGGAKFEEVMRLTGEAGYIIQPGANCAALADYNNDTFVDIYAGYEEEPSQNFFNRGFRSFAINEQLKFKDDDLPGCDGGQDAMIWADFDASGSIELAVAIGNAKFDKAQGAGTAIAVGAKVYWDEAAKVAKADAGGGANKFLGECLAAADADAKVLVRLPQADLYLSRTDLGQADRPLVLSVPVGKDVKSAAPLVVRFYLEGRCLGARVAERFGPGALLGVAEPGLYTIKYRAADGREVVFEKDPSSKAGAPKPVGPSPAAVPTTVGPRGEEQSRPGGSGLMLLLGVLVALAVIVGVVLAIRKKGAGGEQQ